MNLEKIFENFLKNGEKDTLFSKIFQKRYIELLILKVVLIRAPIKIPHFFQVVLIDLPVLTILYNLYYIDIIRNKINLNLLGKNAERN